MQRFTHYLLSHRWLALLLTFAVTFVPVLGVISIIYAAFVTMYKGIYEGALFAVAATLPYIIVFMIPGNGEHLIPLVLGAQVCVAVLSNVLTWALAVMLFRQSTWSNVLQVAALAGVLAISILHLVYPNIADWWGIQLQSYYTQAAAATSGVLKATAKIGADTQVDAINITKQYATGLMVAAILFNGLMQLIIARWWFAIIFKPGSLRRELHNIRLSRLASVLFVVSLGLAYLGNSVVLDIMPILYMLFAAAGLSLIHYMFGVMHAKTTMFWLALVYLTLIFTFPMSLIVVSFLGFFDIWFNLRKRFSKT